MVIFHSYERLKNKELSALLGATGQPLSGKKSILVNRYVTYLASILDKIDCLVPDHEGGGDRYIQPKMEKNKKQSRGQTRQQQQQREEEGKEEHRDLDKIQHDILPWSIVSFDIGIRNLAWVELSREGEILRWDLEDLLVLPSSQQQQQEEEEPEKNDNDDSSTLETKPSEATTTTTRKSSKAKSKKPVAPPFEIRSIALRLDSIMQKIFNGHNNGSSGLKTFPQGVVIEKQRFRSGGMASVLDNIIRCGVIEGMIQMWLVTWKHSMACRDIQTHNTADYPTVEAVSPNAVSDWWGIGAKGRRRKPVEDTEQEEPSTDKPTYQRKKRRSKELVAQWLRRQQSDHNKISEDFLERFRVVCSDELRDWYFRQKKQDDLSDCLLQAVAWFEWRRRAVQEAVKRTQVDQVPLHTCPTPKKKRGSSTTKATVARERPIPDKEKRKRSTTKALL